MDSVTWDHVVYLACISALCWGVALFDYFREEGEKEWARYQQRREVQALVAKLRAAFARGEEFRRIRTAYQRVTDAVNKVEQGHDGRR